MAPKARPNTIVVGPLEANVDKLEAQLKLWAAKIDVLAAKADQAGAQAGIDYRAGIDDLKAKRVVAQAKIDEYKAAGREKWEGFKAGIELAWSDLETALANLKP
jgi:hypothetical protein